MYYAANMARDMNEAETEFERIPLRYRNAFLDVAKPMHCPPGEVICRQGDSDKRLFLLARGMLAVYHEDADGLRTRVGTLKPDNVFGELNFVFGERRIASVVAEAESDVRYLERWQAIEIVERMPSLFHYLERLGVQRWNISALLTHPLIRPLTDTQRRALSGAAYFLTLEGGNTLFDQGQSLDLFWLLLSGRMELCHGDGRSLELEDRACLMPAECVDGEASGWKAVAISECMTVGLPLSMVREFQAGYPVFAAGLKTATVTSIPAR